MWAADALRAWTNPGTAMRWKGVETLKNPLDLIVLQEIIHDTKPDLIVETGSSRGGSACFYGDLGVEVHSVDVAPPKLPASHFLVTYHRGFSTDPSILYFIGEACRDRRVMVLLDSDHHKANVAAELDLYAPLVSSGCYLVVEDTVLDSVDPGFEGDGPAAALAEWLPSHPDFQTDLRREKYGVTMNPGGYLRRV